jgi:peptidoglycan/xylan/chitin deacetylase (PgdA/CDA1 family)
MYHRVLPASSLEKTFSNKAIIVSTCTFEKHVEFLKKNFNILSLDEFEKYLNKGGSYPGKSCLITFDDGWFDNYEYALPVLNKKHVPATIFLPYNYIATSKRFWQEELSASLHLLCDAPNTQQVTEFLKSLPYRIDVSDCKELRSEQIYESVRQIKGLSDPEIDDILEKSRQLSTDLPIQQENIDNYLKWINVKDMMEREITFGSHCLSHRILTGLSKEDISAEIGDSKTNIEAEINTNVKSIAYPNGNYNEIVLKSTQITGYSLGFSTESGHVGQKTNRYAIPRININDVVSHNLPLFYCRLLRIF